MKNDATVVTDTPAQRFVPRTTARLALAGLAVLLILGFSTRIPQQPASANPEQGDAGAYEAVAARIQKGEGYYSAYGDELRKRAYPTASVFNWRTPLLLEAYAAAPAGLSLLIVALGAASILAAILLLRNASPESTVLGVILQVGAAASVVIVAGSATVPETWLGYFLFVSIVAYSQGAYRIGALAAIVGLFVRELAAPYCVAGTLIALRRHRRKELSIWLGGATAYAAYYAYHVTNVMAHRGPDAIAQHGSWIQFGGLPFVLGTLSFNGWFAASQPWGPAIGCVLVLASLWARSAPLHLRVCGVTYLGFFAVVGQSFNQNWGLLAAPAWALCCAYGVGGLRRLIRSSR